MKNPWRKHHQSSITRDIWLCTLGSERTFQKITSFKGEDRNPVWAPDGSSFYYLSEEKGSFNIFKNDLTGKNDRQITNHTTHPVRFLTSDNNGKLCYGYNGEIYTVKEGAKPQKVDVRIISGQGGKRPDTSSSRQVEPPISRSPKERKSPLSYVAMCM